MIDELEAKKKICPFMSALYFSMAFCVTSECMMWKWRKIRGTRDGEFIISKTTGYCAMREENTT